MAIQDQTREGMTRRDFIQKSGATGAVFVAPMVFAHSVALADSAFTENPARMKFETSPLSEISLRSVYRLSTPRYYDI